MNAKTFVDTNILIYAHDIDAETKHATAKTVLLDLWSQRSGALSTQVLQEFYVNVTRKIATPLSRSSARAVVESYTAWCIDTTAAEISAAFRIEDEAGISFWDALIVAAARKAGAARILSED
ncbi:MAG: PIN domain-containing protein, partial [Bryobacteraceae bacterium]|nr:PIN domain-containing protein [Bryobacteraceae bacterium]